MDDHDDRVRKRAHDIWEAEGRPEGREYSHWLRARTEINEEDAAAASAGSPAHLAPVRQGKPKMRQDGARLGKTF